MKTISCEFAIPGLEWSFTLSVSVDSEHRAHQAWQYLLAAGEPDDLEVRDGSQSGDTEASRGDR